MRDVDGKNLTAISIDLHLTYCPRTRGEVFCACLCDVQFEHLVFSECPVQILDLVCVCVCFFDSWFAFGCCHCCPVHLVSNSSGPHFSIPSVSPFLFSLFSEEDYGS
ncbi:hypothetical protein XENOCAPTIV_007780 [Xenoophorus captivus]|uniref:Uncharacterized protein n=1 Tax=Xenoophorus captivus TaxID=1517983 RepID=A0ABV0QH20_9TELE